MPTYIFIYMYIYNGEIQVCYHTHTYVDEYKHTHTHKHNYKNMQTHRRTYTNTHTHIYI